MATLKVNLLTPDDLEARLCREYWLLGDDGRFVFTVAHLAKKYAIGNSKVTARVAAACFAYVPEEACACGRAFPLNSRSHYEFIRRYAGIGEHWVCDDCKQAELLRAQQEAERQAQSRAAILQHEVELRTQQAALLRPLSFTDTVYLLTVMRAGGSDDLSFIKPCSSLTTQLSPTTELDYEILRYLFRAGMLCASPYSAASSVVIEEGRLASVELPSASWTLPLPKDGPSPAQFLESQERILRSEQWPEDWRAEADALALEVALHECLRYVEVALDAHRFKAQLGEKIRVVLRSALQEFSISQVYNFIWNAAKNAASFFLQKEVHRAHAVNTVPGSIQRQAERALVAKREVYPFRRDFRAPESQISHVVFTLALRLPDGGFNTVCRGRASS